MFGYALSEHEPSQSHIVLGTLAGHEADTCICLATPIKNQVPRSPIALRIASVKEHFPPQLSWVVTLIIPCTFAEFERNQISVVCLLFLRKMAEKNILNNSEEKETRANWTSDAEIIPIEEVMKFEDRLFRKMKGARVKGKHGYLRPLKYTSYLRSSLWIKPDLTYKTHNTSVFFLK